MLHKSLACMSSNSPAYLERAVSYASPQIRLAALSLTIESMPFLHGQGDPHFLSIRHCALHVCRGEEAHMVPPCTGLPTFCGNATRRAARS